MWFTPEAERRVAMQAINSAVYAEAALMTDGRITDDLLADVATMRGLPLYVERVLAPAPDPRLRELEAADGALASAQRVYAFARAAIGDANRTSLAPVLCGGRVVSPATRLTAQRVRERKSDAFRLFNLRRGQLAAAKRRVAAARKAVAPVVTVASTRRRPAQGVLPLAIAA
jgi:hypothetical protein